MCRRSATCTLQAEMSLLQDLEEIYHTLQGRCSDLEADKAAKLQASQRFADELEAEKDDYQEKLSNANELIMQHLSSQVGVLYGFLITFF